MTSEFEDVRKGYYRSRVESASARLAKKGFDARAFASAIDAVRAVLEIIPAGSAVGAGGSVTLQESGLLDRLRERGDSVVSHTQDMDFAESLRVRKEAIVAPYFLSSSNAVTLTGELVNTDGIGNRVSGMVFGPGTVFVIAGVNKIVADREEAFSRIRNVAAPANARRLGMDVPCVEKGYCVDCRSPMNICRVTTIVMGKPMLTDLKVFLVAEPLGL